MLLLDVSGSMEPYARAFLRFVHAAVVGRTPRRGVRARHPAHAHHRELSSRDPDAALRAAAAAVVDWSGGTRSARGCAAFNDEWGVRGMARGAVVVILSDGWDRGEPEVLAEQMARLQRVAHQIVWVNPLKATPGYAPLAREWPPRSRTSTSSSRATRWPRSRSSRTVIVGVNVEQWSDEGGPRRHRPLASATGNRVAVARVVGIEGSGPREPGATMAVNDAGEVAGSVSGGCVEGAVVTEALAVLDGDAERGRDHVRLLDDEAFAVGLTCGGTIHLFVEPLDW